MSMRKKYVDGHLLNVRTANMLKTAEDRLGYSLSVMQGSYNGGGVSASAGTHDGGGAVDVRPGSNPNEIVRALREVGFAAWHRMPSQGPWVEHIHAIAIGDGDMSSGARNQVSQYYSGHNGLANYGRDDGPRLNPIPKWKISFPTVWSRTVINQFGAKTPAKRTSVARVQKALDSRGYNPGPADGIAGPQTQKAFKRFQAKRGYKVDGVMTRNILRVICKGYNRVL